MNLQDNVLTLVNATLNLNLILTFANLFFFESDQLREYLNIFFQYPRRSVMDWHLFAKDYRRQLVAYFTMLCMLFSSHIPSSLSAEVAVITNDDDEICNNRRTHIAYALAGVALIGVVGGIAYAASFTGKKCHHSSSSCSSSSCSYYSYYDSDYSSSHSSHHHHHSCHGSHCSRSGSYTDYTYSFPSNYYSSSDESIQDVPPGERAIQAPLPLIERRKANKSHHSPKISNRLSGLFISHAATLGQGSATAFVQLPDGSRNVLGQIPLSGSGCISLPFGPFHQAGDYIFGLCVDEGTSLPTQTSAGSVRIEVNGSMTQSHDFLLPPNPPPHYEPAPCSFTL